MARDAERVSLGRISGCHGVRGWVKVVSYTEPRTNIFEYQPWLLCRGADRRETAVVEGREHGRTLIARLVGVDDRDAARELIGLEIAVHRAQLPEPAEGEFYWTDLIGLTVATTKGQVLGVVDRLMETGANDVLVVKGDDRERLVPFIRDQIVRIIDLDAGTMEVDWDPEF